MILDSSAVVALVRREAGHETLRDLIDLPVSIGIGAPTQSEAAMVLMSRIGRAGPGMLAIALRELEADVIPFTEAHAVEALAAFRRFGKGRHPAQLNFGDCMTYAVALVAGEPLLCLGGDFAKTDLQLVVRP